MADLRLTTKQRNKIKRALKALDDVRIELQQENPDYYISWYLEDCGNFLLLENHAHDDSMNHYAQHHVVIEGFHLDEAGGGGW